jgi:uncharacterized damage-inducible protein DinB
MKQLREASIEAIDQIQHLLQALSSDDYCCYTEFSSSTIGAHVRHVVDHYLALQVAVTGTAAIPRIDFNLRHRHSAVERDVCAATATLAELSEWLRTTGLDDGPVEVESEVSLSTNCNKVFRSTLSRELCYLINHTVHHSAYMSVIARQLGARVENTVGIAPATGSHLRAVASRKTAEA